MVCSVIQPCIALPDRVSFKAEVGIIPDNRMREKFLVMLYQFLACLFLGVKKWRNCNLRSICVVRDVVCVQNLDGYNNERW